MSTTKKRAPVRAENTYFCETCRDNKKYSHADIMEHLRSVHKLDTNGLKCNRRMTLHFDAADYYSSQYEVTIGDNIKLLNNVINPRRKEDRFY